MGRWIPPQNPNPSGPRYEPRPPRKRADEPARADGRTDGPGLAIPAVVPYAEYRALDPVGVAAAAHDGADLQCHLLAGPVRAVPGRLRIHGPQRRTVQWNL